jgi:hypothetical protein
MNSERPRPWQITLKLSKIKDKESVKNSKGKNKLSHIG